MMRMSNVQDTKQKIIDLLKEGKTLCEISRILFNSNSSSTVRINQLIDSYGLRPYEYSDRYAYMNKQWLQEQINTLGSVYEVVKHYGFSRTSVTRYAKRFGLYEVKFHRNAKNSIDETYFETIDTHNKAYWLGFIMADGCMYCSDDNSKIELSVKIQQGDLKLLQDFAKDIQFPIDKISLFQRKTRETVCYSAQIKTCNKNFCYTLMKHGIVSQKTGHETFPNTIPKAFKSDFIRGFWDGDGSVKHEEISVCSTSFDIISSLSKWLCHELIHYTVEQHKNSDIFELKISKYSWLNFLDIVYPPSSLSLERKMKIANEIRSILLKNE